MIYSHEVEMMCPVAQGANHGPAPIPEEAKWVKAKEVKDISGLTHGAVSYTHLIKAPACRSRNGVDGSDRVQIKTRSGRIRRYGAV